MSWLRRLVGQDQLDEGPNRVRAELQALFDEHGLAAFERQLRFADLVGDRDWVLDQGSGQLRLGDDLAFAVQIIGTTSATTATWRWSWANSSIDGALTQRARDAEAIGRERGVSMLTRPDLDLTDVLDGRVVALVTAGLLDADAYYRGHHAAGEVYMLVDAPQVQQRTDLPAVRCVNVISEALLGLPIPLTGTAVATYLGGLGLSVSQRGREVRVEGGDAATFTFDKLGRLTAIRGTAGSAIRADTKPPARPDPGGIPLRDWHDAALESHPGWRDTRGHSPTDVLRRYQEGRHGWEREANRAGDRRWPEMKDRLEALYGELATPRPIGERDTTFGNPPSRDPAHTRIVGVSGPKDDRATISIEEDDPTGLTVQSYDVEAVVMNGEWRLDDRVAVYDDERIPGLL